MYEDELKRVEKKVVEIIRQRKIREKKVYLFGVSDNTRQIIQMLRNYKIEPICVIDNDITKQGGFCARIPVVALEMVPNLTAEENVFFLYSGYWREMFAQLENYNVKRKQIHILFKKKESLVNLLYSSWKGKVVYRDLTRKYGRLPIFLCPYTGTGDIYLIGTFWKEYIEKNGIDNYIFVVISNACKKVAMMFNIKNVEVLTKKIECYHLLNYYKLCPDNVDIKILNDCWPQVHTNQLEWFRGYKGLGFMELFRKYVFDLADTALPQHPVYKNVEGEINHLFAKEKVKFGGTVVLSPYANTLSDLPDEFWKLLVKKLKKKGFIVCTNSSGETEPAIEGTFPVFFPLNIAPQFITAAGYFVGIRSGFCDVISGANAKKIILYDSQNRFYQSSAYEYFSLRKMKLCRDAIEIEFSHGCEDKCIDKIMNVI